MKNSIKLTALTLVLSACLFAANTVKADGPAAPSAKNEITFSSLPSHNGVDIKVERSEPGKAIVMIYDQNDNVIFKDALPGYKVMEKGYILNQLQNGDYTIEVISNKTVAKKEIHVYEEDRTRVFLVRE